MLALLTLDLQNRTVTLLDIVVTPQGGFELNIIGLCPPILSVLHSVFIPTIIPRMIGLSPGTHLQMTHPFECILQSIAAPPSPPSLWGSGNISAVVGAISVDVGAVSGAAAVGTLVMLLLLLLLFQRWRRHRKAMLKEPHLAQGLRARHTEMMALKLPMEIVQAKLVLAKLPEKQHELKPSYTHALPPRPRNPATVRRGDGATMTELPKMGVPVFIVSQPRRERFVSVGTQTTFCEQERSVLSEVLFESPQLETASVGGDLGRGKPHAKNAHLGAGVGAVERASAQGSAPGSASSSAQSSAQCSSSSSRDSGSGTRKATGEATVAAPASGWETGQELPRAQYDLRPKTADHLNVLPPSYTDFGAVAVERASALNVGQVLDGLLAPSGASCQASRSCCAPQAPPHAREGTPSLFPSNFESRQQSTAGRRSENANLFKTTFEKRETHRNDSRCTTVPDYENVETKERQSRQARSHPRNAWYEEAH